MEMSISALSTIMIAVPILDAGVPLLKTYIAVFNMRCGV
jgi:hypothetical protein